MKKRHREILFIITKDYINTSKPVSSSRVKELSNLNCSCATIRNEMAYLEKIQMLEKPYKVSGSIPTSKGYHYYIDHSEISLKYKNLERLINEIFINRATSIDGVLEQTCVLISEILKLPVAMFKTKNKQNRIQTIHLFKLNDKKAMVVVISNEKVLYEKVIEVDKNDYDDLKMSLAIISKRLFNCPLNEVMERLNGIIPILSNHIQIFEEKLKKLVLSVFKKAIMEVSVYGTKNISSIPEFKNTQMLHKLLTLLDDNNIWSLLSKRFFSFQGIDAKLAYTKDKNFSVMSLDLESNITLLVVGPKRVNYPMIMATLELIRKNTLRKKFMITFNKHKEESYESKK